MSSRSQTYEASFQLIADILSFQNPVEKLKEKLLSNTVNWESLVMVASDYLVLTSCYCSLKRKELLAHIPEDLKTYLEELTSINTNRNKTIKIQLSEIAETLNANHIDYVFLKGAAFLMSELYQDLGERMISDIDILVSEEDLFKSYELLASIGYRKTAQGTSSKFFDYKHLPKLQSDTHLAAVEVHKKLTLKSLKGILDPKEILRTKVAINSTFVPSSRFLQLHCILNFQVNDSGFMYNRLSFKTIYDLLILKQKGHFDQNLLTSHKYLRHFLSLAKAYFRDLQNFRSYPLTNFIFRLKHKYPSLRRIIDVVIDKIRFFKAILTTRIWTFLNNKEYRKAIFNDYRGI